MAPARGRKPAGCGTSGRPGYCARACHGRRSPRSWATPARALRSAAGLTAARTPPGRPASRRPAPARPSARSGGRPARPGPSAPTAPFRDRRLTMARGTDKEFREWPGAALPGVLAVTAVHRLLATRHCEAAEFRLQASRRNCAGPGWRALSGRTLPRRRPSAARVRPELRRLALRHGVLDHLGPGLVTPGPPRWSPGCRPRAGRVLRPGGIAPGPAGASPRRRR
jgi:hypothetical protein